TPFTVPCVPTGMNAGVSTTPCGVVNRAVRARELASSWSSSKPNCEDAIAEIESVAAELEVLQRQLFANFVEACDAEILAFQQVVARPPHQFADCRQAQADHA